MHQLQPGPLTAPASRPANKQHSMAAGCPPCLPSSGSSSSPGFTCSVRCMPCWKRLRAYLDTRPGPQGPRERMMEPGVTPQSQAPLANLCGQCKV